MTASTSRDPRLGHAFYRSLLQSKRDGQKRVENPPPAGAEEDGFGELEYPDSPEDVVMADATAVGESDGKKTEEQAPCRSSEREQQPAHARVPLPPSTSKSAPHLTGNPPSKPLLPHRTSVPLKSALSNPLPPRSASAAAQPIPQQSFPSRSSLRTTRTSVDVIRAAAFDARLYEPSSSPAQGPGQPLPPRRPPSPATGPSSSLTLPARPSPSSPKPGSTPSSSRRPLASQQSPRYQPYPPPTAQAGQSMTGPDQSVGPQKTSKAPTSSSKPKPPPASPPPDFSSLSLRERQERRAVARDEPSASRPLASSSAAVAAAVPLSSNRPPEPSSARPVSSSRSSAAPAPAPAPAAPASPPPPTPRTSTSLSRRRRLPIAPTSLTRSPASPTAGFSGTTPHFTVSENRIVILASDATAATARVPAEGTHRDTRGKPFHYERVFPTSGEASYRTGLGHWQGAVGKYVAAVMFGRKQTGNDPRWIVERWPENYTFWVAIKPKTDGKDGQPRKPRKDYYLYGSPTATFASPMEFVPHAVWLMSGRPGGANACECKYCSKEDQQPISARLERVWNECGEGEVYGG